MPHGRRHEVGVRFLELVRDAVQFDVGTRHQRNVVHADALLAQRQQGIARLDDVTGHEYVADLHALPPWVLSRTIATAW